MNKIWISIIIVGYINNSQVTFKVIHVVDILVVDYVGIFRKLLYWCIFFSFFTEPKYRLFPLPYNHRKSKRCNQPTVFTFLEKKKKWVVLVCGTLNVKMYVLHSCHAFAKVLCVVFSMLLCSCYRLFWIVARGLLSGSNGVLYGC